MEPKQSRRCRDRELEARAEIVAARLEHDTAEAVDALRDQLQAVLVSERAFRLACAGDQPRPRSAERGGRVCLPPVAFLGELSPGDRGNGVEEHRG